MMRDTVRDFFSRHPDVSLGALGANENRLELDLEPWGTPVRFFAAEERPDLVERYRAANLFAFPGELLLPGWVLSDLYLLPGAIGLLLAPARTLAPDRRKRLDLHADDEAIVAAYLGAPTVTRGLFIGVSLISLLPGLQAGAWVKSLTLKMLRADRMRGVAQWQNPSVRVHTRLAPLRIVGPVPGIHEFRSKSFVYETMLRDERMWQACMARRIHVPPSERIPAADTDRLGAVLARAEAGELVHVVPPGLDAQGNVLLHWGELPPITYKGEPPP